MSKKNSLVNDGMLSPSEIIGYSVRDEIEPNGIILSRCIEGCDGNLSPTYIRTVDGISRYSPYDQLYFSGVPASKDYEIRNMEDLIGSKILCVLGENRLPDGLNPKKAKWLRDNKLANGTKTPSGKGPFNGLMFVTDREVYYLEKRTNEEIPYYLFQPMSFDGLLVSKTELLKNQKVIRGYEKLSSPEKVA
jgi:hypothetical protein